jgi:hypothetical protein
MLMSSSGRPREAGRRRRLTSGACTGRTARSTDLTFTASWPVSSPNCRTRLGHSWFGQYTTRLVAGSGSASRCSGVLAQATGPRLRGSRIPDPRDQERIHLCPALGARVRAGYCRKCCSGPRQRLRPINSGLQWDPEFFMPGTLRVRSYRQRKAGTCGRYSHRDLYGGADDWAAASAQPAGTALLFPGLAVAVFCASPASPRKERPQ